MNLNKIHLKTLILQYLSKRDAIDLYQMQRILNLNSNETFQLKYWLNQENLPQENIESFVEDWKNELNKLQNQYKQFNVIIAIPLAIKGSRLTEVIKKESLQRLFARQDTLIDEICFFHELEEKKFKEIPFQNFIDLEKCIFFKSKNIHALNYEHTVDLFYDNFNIQRAVVNFILESIWHNTRTYRSFIASSLSAIPDWKFAIVNDSLRDEIFTNAYHYFHQEYLAVAQEDLNKVFEHDYFKTIYNHLNDLETNPLVKRLLHSITVFQKALDYRVLEDVYAEFYKTLEIASDVRNNRNIKEVLYVIGRKLKKDGNVQTNNLIRNWRNDYAHESKFNEISEYVVDIIREYSKISIGMLLFIIKNGFSDDSALKHYYTLMSCTSTEFDVMKKMSNLINA